MQDTLADTIQHGVDPIGGQSPDPTDDTVSMRDRKHSDGPQKLVVPRRSGANDASFPRERQLRRHRPDAASRAMDEDGLSRLDLQGLDDSAVGRETRQRQACGLLPARRARLPRQCLGRSADQFSVGAVM